MIVFQGRVGYFGEYGWRTIGFWSWLDAWMDDRVVRVIIGSEISLWNSIKDGHHSFDKLVPKDRLLELTWQDRSPYILE